MVRSGVIVQQKPTMGKPSQGFPASQNWRTVPARLVHSGRQTNPLWQPIQSAFAPDPVRRCSDQVHCYMTLTRRDCQFSPRWLQNWRTVAMQLAHFDRQTGALWQQN